ncbi:MAG: hypothetical protein LBL82_01725 [Oscillospiraceae bacterium]|jgi:aspartate carbamoyltransferase catalytic subunit|nr:hypothetical protein [Oscillospiraceae bacterium]
MQDIVAKGFISSFYIAKTVTEQIYNDILSFDIRSHYAPSGFVVGVLCEESSSRTRFSTESAIQKLGGNVIHFSSLEETSIKKGETLEESSELWSNYFDLIAIRSQKEMVPYIVSKHSTVPVINLGDGGNEHPTQGLATLVHAYKVFGKIRGLNICLWGDFLKSRTVHSVAIAFSALGANVTICSIPGISEQNMTLNLINRFYPDAHITFVDSIENIRDDIDIFYITRLQQERWKVEPKYEKFLPSYCNKLSENGIVLHSLPHNNEIGSEVLYHRKSKIHDHIKITLKTREWLLCQYKTAFDNGMSLVDNTCFNEGVYGGVY